MTTSFRTAALTLSALLVLAAAGPAAAAVAFEGSFSGIARARVVPGGDVGPPGSWAAFFDGAAVEGTFRIDIPAPERVDDTGFGRAYGLGPSGEMQVRYALRGHSFTQRGSMANELDPWMFLDRDVASGTQSLSFRTEYLVRFDGATLAFDAPDSRFFDGTDADTFRVPASLDGVTLRTTLIAPAHRVRFEVDVARFTLSPLASPVPEPATLGLLAVGLAVLGASRRRPAPARAVGLEEHHP